MAALETKIKELETKLKELEGKTQAGGVVVTWPGGSNFSNTVKIAHGLGAAIASVTTGCGVATDGGIENTVGLLAVTAAEIQLRVYRTTGAPGAGITASVFWIASK